MNEDCAITGLRFPITAEELLKFISTNKGKRDYLLRLLDKLNKLNPGRRDPYLCFIISHDAEFDITEKNEVKRQVVKRSKEILDILIPRHMAYETYDNIPTFWEMFKGVSNDEKAFMIRRSVLNARIKELNRIIKNESKTR